MASKFSLSDEDKERFNKLLSGSYRDTGETASNPGEYLDSVLGAPVRTAISEYQHDSPIKEALYKTLSSFGKDPKKAPTGVDIASDAGIQNPYLGAGVATAVDLGAQIPVGTISKIAKSIPMAGLISDEAKSAKGLLATIKTPEQATALSGEAKQKYLEALDTVFGPREERAKDLGFGDKTWYHGTSVPIDEFKDEAKGLSTNAQSAKKGFFFAQDPSTASDYADLAHEKGIIREGDSVTTKYMSDNHIEPDKIGYSDVDSARRSWRDARGLTLDKINNEKLNLEKNIAYWDEARTNPDKFKYQLSGKGLTGDQLADQMQAKLKDRFNEFYGNGPATKQDVESAKKDFFNAVKQFNATNDQTYANKTNNIYLETRDPEERDILKSAITAGQDASNSGGQNVLPVRLQGNENTIHVKNYGGESYRDTTYADEMSKAQDQGKTGVLFKNTFDPGDPHNRIQQNIAAVFNPNQIRSVNASFDPRFKDSSNLLAGTLGVNPAQSGAAQIAKAGGNMAQSGTSFNPDQYLSEKTGGGSPQGFDPDSYLKEKTGAALEKPSVYSKGQTALEHGANAAAFGYLPQLQAAAAPRLEKAYNAITGNDTDEKLKAQGFDIKGPDDTYLSRRDTNVKRLQAEQEENPKSALAGTAAGALTSAIATPVPGGAASGLGRALLKGAGYGAAQGALSNPGDVEGEINPTQLPERGKNALTGAAVGGVATGVAQGAKGLLGALSKSGQSAEDFAATKAFKGSGAMLKDFRTAASKNQVKDIGNFMLDNGLIKAGDTFDDVAEKTQAFNKDAGSKLEKVYSSAQKAIESSTPEEKAAIESASFNPVKDKDAILSAISDKLKNAEGKRAAINRVSNYLDELAVEHGDKALDPKTVNDVKGAMDDVINYSRNPLTKQPNDEKAFQIARRAVSQKIDDSIEQIGSVTGEDTLKALKDANKDYGYSAQIKNIAKDRMNRENANRMFGLTDTIAGTAGAAAGGAAGALIGGDSKHTLEGAGLGLLAGVGNKLGRTYGPGIQAGAARTIAPALGYTAEPVGRALSPLVQNPGLLGGAAAATSLRRKQLEKR